MHDFCTLAYTKYSLVFEIAQPELKILRIGIGMKKIQAISHDFRTLAHTKYGLVFEIAQPELKILRIVVGKMHDLT